MFDMKVLGVVALFLVQVKPKISTNVVEFRIGKFCTKQVQLCYVLILNLLQF